MNVRPSGAPIRRAAQAAGRAAVLSLPASPGWVALAHPAQWAPVCDMSGQWHVLPKLRRITLLPGVGLVGIGRDSAGARVADPRRAIADAVADGSVEVPRCAVEANGEAFADYCVRYPTKGGAAHVWAWERPELARAGRSIVTIDRDAQVAFLRWVASDLLGMDGPEPDTLDEFRGTMRAQARRLIIGAQRSPTRRAALDRVAEILRSLGWDEGLDLPAAPQPRAPTLGSGPSYTVAQLEAMLAAARTADPHAVAEPVSSHGDGEGAAPPPRPVRRAPRE
jgi:hypothetical protein